ncbi:Zn-dependent hydrolase [Kocuria sp. CNJ-770]|uniref:M20 family metallo-hydrolase n=1 Tax=Kocuria sp. CNJ-770 TaxID=1904964 RepID=UPI0009615B83|nr:M20 family metallo-hydrolase [Kocuria sp. CNJ-770]OLT10244.1 Zn-dependent hydrolase [Kocuria sp. CNJ-770]
MPFDVVEATQRVQEQIDRLSRLRAEDRPGWSRQVFGEPYRESRAWVAATMREAGLEVHRDAAGNLVGRLAGTSPSAPALMTGSHTDTVDGGGRFDGVVGVLGAIEAARSIRESGTPLSRDLLVFDFLGEESNEYGLSCLGSRTMAGELTAADLDRRNSSGRSLGSAYDSFGLDPSALLDPARTAPGPLHGYVELHIEQGPTLEREGEQIGVVTSICGIERFVAHFAGREDHAGTRPVADRHDAMVAAAEAVLAVRSEGCGAPGVATTTHVRNRSSSPNVVPSAVDVSGELRSIDRSWLTGAKRRLGEQILSASRGYGVDVDFDWTSDNEIVEAHPRAYDLVAATTAELGYSWRPVPSGATHDAVHLASLAPMAMIFVPSRDGRSHCPEEWTDAADIGRGVHVLAETLRALDTARL